MTPQPLFTAIEAAAATGGYLCRAPGGRASDARGESDWQIGGLSFDTRTLKRGDMFVALAGERDGHDFLGQAAAAGAAAALVDRVNEGMPGELPLLKVEGSTLSALHDLAAAARDRHFGKLVAVTGSVGKTSTKEMLRAALGASGSVHAAAKSFNNHIGVPVSLAGLPMSARFGVFEIGMNHPGEITPLTRLVRPHVSIITTIAAVHLEHFSSVDEIAAAKAEILHGLRPGGVAVLPADNEYFGFLTEEAASLDRIGVIPFGESDAAEPGVRLLDYVVDGARATVTARLFGDIVSFGFPAAGRHQALNAMAVLASAVALGLPVEEVLRGLSGFEAGDGRGARFELELGGKTVTVLDESYNANPTSMRASFESLAAMPLPEGGRRIAVLGEMGELGPTADALHAALAEPLLATGVGEVFLSGKGMAPLAEALRGKVKVIQKDTADALRAPLAGAVRTGDVLLFKGSNATGISAMLSAIRADQAQRN